MDNRRKGHRHWKIHIYTHIMYIYIHIKYVCVIYKYMYSYAVYAALLSYIFFTMCPDSSLKKNKIKKRIGLVGKSPNWMEALMHLFEWWIFRYDVGRPKGNTVADLDVHLPEFLVSHSSISTCCMYDSPLRAARFSKHHLWWGESEAVTIHRTIHRTIHVIPHFTCETTILMVSVISNQPQSTINWFLYSISRYLMVKSY